MKTPTPKALCAIPEHLSRGCGVPSHIILLGSYIGSSSFIYDVSCSGEKLSPEEVVELGYWDKSRHEKQFEKVRYSFEWYVVRPDAVIKIVEGELGATIEHTFLVPEISPQWLPASPEDFGYNRQADILKKCLIHVSSTMPQIEETSE